MSKHTPGPWIAHRATGDYLIYDEESGKDLAIALDRGKHDAKANSALIASAPLLLEALEACERELSQYVAWAHKTQRGCSVEVEEAAVYTRSAIRQAKGAVMETEANIYQMPQGDWACAVMGIISDGFSTREKAEQFAKLIISQEGRVPIIELAERLKLERKGKTAIKNAKGE